MKRREPGGSTVVAAALMDRYEKVRVLGRGSYGTAVLVRLAGGGGYARGGAAASAAPAATPTRNSRRDITAQAARAMTPTKNSRRGAAPNLVGAATPARNRRVASVSSPPSKLWVAKEVPFEDLDEKRRDDAMREAEMLKSLSHRNIIAYKDAFLEETRLCIVMEYADGGDLAGALERRRAAGGKRYHEREVMAVFGQLVLAVEYIHERRILHRDLKSQNVFLTSAGVPKVGDFGIAKVLHGSDVCADTKVGTLICFAPEMIEDQPYGLKVDIWCLGIILYEMLALEVPFTAKSVATLVVRICTSEPRPVAAAYSSELRGLLSRMLSKTAEERPSAAEIAALPHVRRGIPGNDCAFGGSRGDASCAAVEKAAIPKVVAKIPMRALMAAPPPSPLLSRPCPNHSDPGEDSTGLGTSLGSSGSSSADPMPESPKRARVAEAPVASTQSCNQTAREAWVASEPSAPPSAPISARKKCEGLVLTGWQPTARVRRAELHELGLDDFGLLSPPILHGRQRGYPWRAQPTVQGDEQQAAETAEPEPQHQEMLQKEQEQDRCNMAPMPLSRTASTPIAWESSSAMPGLDMSCTCSAFIQALEKELYQVAP